MSGRIGSSLRTAPRFWPASGDGGHCNPSTRFFLQFGFWKTTNELNKS